ncbi:MAG: hypothetical protein CL939_01390 [Deltaproteobacteria bacterium]|nr:hypothetical protein [Deltaproteobacteria bacterium]
MQFSLNKGTTAEMDMFFLKTSFILMPIVDLRLPLSSAMHVVKRIEIMTKSSNTNPEGYRRGLRRTGGAKRAF